MSLFSDLDDLAVDVAGDSSRALHQQLRLLTERLKQHPQVVFHLLREVRPVFVKGDLAIVTRYDDVVEVLTHDEAFSVTGYSGPMQEITGDFILGLDPGAHYERDVSLLRLAFRRSDVSRVAEIAQGAAARCVAAATGRIDVVRDLADRVPAAVVEEFLGAPGPDQDTLITWARSLFTHIFVDLDRDRILQDQARDAAAAIRPHLDTLVAARKQALTVGSPVSDDLLTRLLRQQVLGEQAFTDVEIRSQLIGLLVGMIPTISKAATLAVNELFERPDALEGARRAIHDGDDALFDRYVTEAMRLAPQAPGLLRVATQDYPIARGTHHEQVIRKGMTVFTATQSAMLDGDEIDDPGDFRLDRPDTDYLHFGAGLHQCFGRHVSVVMIPAIVAAALSIDGAQRVGDLAMDGNWPVSLILEFPA